MNTFKRFILEADQDEITEEDGDMNDDELNGLIAPQIRSCYLP